MGLLQLMRDAQLCTSQCHQVGRIRGTEGWHDGCVFKRSIEVLVVDGM
jgi:hypothetical protein